MPSQSARPQFAAVAQPFHTPRGRVEGPEDATGDGEAPAPPQDLLSVLKSMLAEQAQEQGAIAKQLVDDRLAAMLGEVQERLRAVREELRAELNERLDSQRRETQEELRSVREELPAELGEVLDGRHRATLEELRAMRERVQAELGEKPHGQRRATQEELCTKDDMRAELGEKLDSQRRATQEQLRAMREGLQAELGERLDSQHWATQEQLRAVRLELQAELGEKLDSQRRATQEQLRAVRGLLRGIRVSPLPPVRPTALATTTTPARAPVRRARARRAAGLPPRPGGPRAVAPSSMPRPTRRAPPPSARSVTRPMPCGLQGGASRHVGPSPAASGRCGRRFGGGAHRGRPDAGH
ncbi:unnamed protein product [Prorocentrum cordatum]|uniref:Uncharacterized protein n=1 Tax=Prorocentrum cordatum TaxID=2364126 RepID=A0ABN9PUL6_9DINO|nr:unnamed protein product [Polarella glacialis]